MGTVVEKLKGAVCGFEDADSEKLLDTSFEVGEVLEDPGESEKPISMLDALVAAFAPLAAMFDAANGRGSAQFGVSPVVFLPWGFLWRKAFAWAAAPIAFCHRGGLCLMRPMDAAIF